MELFIASIEDKPDAIDTWDDNLWLLLIEQAVVHHDKSITFKFTNIKEITIVAEKMTAIFVVAISKFEL